jgi:hypothetical protein
MRHAPSISALFKTGGFLGHYYLGQALRIGFTGQCILVAVISAVFVLAGSFIDRTLILKGGDIGLFQHPAIWAFFVLQVALPLSVRHSLRRLEDANKAKDQTDELKAVYASSIAAKVSSFVQLRDGRSRAIATICYGVGLIAFVWNTYQNQLPGIILPQDFWDSSNHFWGYWITRVYKFYLFVWFLPYIALIHSAVLLATLRLIREKRTGGELSLQPFHPDDVGGLGFVPGLVTTPIIVTVLIAALPLAGAIDVHRRLDVTPIMGMIIVFGGALVAYVVPILYLRTDIIALKLQAIEKLSTLQQRYYAQIVKMDNIRSETLREGREALDYFEKIDDRIQKISNYPHLATLLKYLGLALTPAVASLALKVYEVLGPMLIPLLERP